jgi:hypothetical protein
MLPDPSEKPGSVFDAFATLVLSLPVVIRALVVLAVLVLGAAFVYYKYSPRSLNQPLPPIATAPVGAPYNNGQPDLGHPGAVNNAQNVEANHKAQEDNAAYEWHTNHKADDDPLEIPIVPDADQNNFLRFQYYAKTDRCLLIHRREGGVDHSQWIRDPMYHSHDVDQKMNVGMKALDISSGAPGNRVADFIDRLFPAASASAILDVPALSDVAKPEPIQTNFCVNPHQGTFRYWWGQPIDQCNSPMYRQFGDGCTHYQIYNRCANSWDGRIFWVTCNPPPHH